LRLEHLEDDGMHDNTDFGILQCRYDRQLGLDEGLFGGKGNALSLWINDKDLG
jgi:hypothetical protein